MLVKWTTVSEACGMGEEVGEPILTTHTGEIVGTYSFFGKVYFAVSDSRHFHRVAIEDCTEIKDS